MARRRVAVEQGPMVKIDFMTALTDGKLIRDEIEWTAVAWEAFLAAESTTAGVAVDGVRYGTQSSNGVTIIAREIL